MSGKIIDYLAGSPNGLPAREQIELDALIFGGERSTAEIAGETGLSERTVTRRRRTLKEQGFRLPPPLDACDKWNFREAQASHWRSSFGRRRDAR